MPPPSVIYTLSLHDALPSCRDHRRIPPHDHPGTAADRLGPGADPDRAVVRAVGAVRGGRLAHLLGSGGAGEPRRTHAAPLQQVFTGLHLLGTMIGCHDTRSL